MSELIRASCAFELSKDPPPENGLAWLQVMPAGAFKPSDGRKMESPHWYIDASHAAKLIDEFKRRKNPTVIDYEHQTIHAKDNGQPAPAAGFMHALEWREGSGLWALAEYTKVAKEQIKNGQYRYFSPVFKHDRKGIVKTLELGALTNNPAIDGMAAVQAASRLFHPPKEEPAMTDNTAETKESPADLSAIASALQLDKSADKDSIIAACSALKAQANQAPDPAQYVSVAVMQNLQAQVAALSAQIQAGEANALINEALKAGKLLPAQREWASAYANKDLAGFKDYLDSAPAVAALTKLQANHAPAPSAEGLSDVELRIAKATGMTAKEFAAAKTDSEE